MKKVCLYIVFGLLVIIFYSLTLIDVNAEENGSGDLNLRYKIINHDTVKLRWNSVDDSVFYVVCKCDKETGKVLKEFKVTSNAVTLKNLSPDTEYSYYVYADKSNTDKSKLESNVITFTTPVEWFIDKQVFESDNGEWDLKTVRRHYDGSGEEDVMLCDRIIMLSIKLYAGDNIFYCNTIDGEWDYQLFEGGYDECSNQALYCTKNNGKDTKEIMQVELSNLYDGLSLYEYDNNIIIVKNYRKNASADYGNISGLYVYSVSDDKLISVVEDKNIRINDVKFYDSRVYFRKQNIKWIEKQDEEYPFPEFYGKVLSTGYFSVDSDGTHLKKDNLFKLVENNISENCFFIDGNYMYYEKNTSLCRYDLKSKKESVIFHDDSGKFYDVELIGNKIYFTKYDNADNKYFYCLKENGTLIEKRKTPFEWYY